MIFCFVMLLPLIIEINVDVTSNFANTMECIFDNGVNVFRMEQ